MKDEPIIELLRNHQYQKASEKLYTYFPVVKKLILKNNGSKQDAEDIYQEALVILIRKTQDTNFTLTSSLNTYLYSVCRYLWNDELKKKNKTVNDAKNLPYLSNEDFKEHIHEETAYKQAEKAFNQLGDKCKQLLKLFYFDKISMKEIAAKVGFSTEKVAKNQKYRCIEKAKENLKTLKSI
ncbi:MAG TPA: sigma-70 family RNA polymerase sigma factor [Bacteroidia bacterium]|nr:sigma-70 family RNA polymerase sigma factor [Bacteroidia bacterium]